MSVIEDTSSDPGITHTQGANGADTYDDIRIVLVIPAGGTTTPMSVSGSITPAAALTNQGRKALAGSSTPSGTLTKQTRKPLAGSSTPSGAARQARTEAARRLEHPKWHAFTASLVKALTVAGTITATGALVKNAAKALTASATPTGALAKQATKPLAGELDASRIPREAGHEAARRHEHPCGRGPTKTAAKALTGTSTPAGTLAKQTRKNLTGAATITGTLVKTVAKDLAGTITPTGVLGRIVDKAFAGVLALAGQIATVFLPGTTTADPNPLQLVFIEHSHLVLVDQAHLVLVDRPALVLAQPTHLVFVDDAHLTFQEGS